MPLHLQFESNQSPFPCAKKNVSDSSASDGTGVFESVTLWYYGPGDTNNTLTSEQFNTCLAQVLDCVAAISP